MKKLVTIAAVSFAMAMPMVATSAAKAQEVGVTYAIADQFLSAMVKGMEDKAKTMPGVKLQIEEANNDINKQISQVENFVAKKVKAIIVNVVDTSAAPKISAIAEKAGIPLVYVNRKPLPCKGGDCSGLPKNIVYVGSDERVSGTVQTKEVCKLLGGKGNIVVMMGELSNEAAVTRTQDIEDVIKTPECSGMKIIEKQTANWNREQAQNLMTNWLSKGVKFDAFIANNDEMALGGIQAMEAAKVAKGKIIIAGIDATPPALDAVAAKKLDVTVFQNASAQGGGSVQAAVDLAAGKTVAKIVDIPFELVTLSNLSQYKK